MNKLDFINAMATFASHYAEKYGDQDSKILAKFINYAAWSNSFDYGIYAEEIKNHKKKIYTPADSDLLIANIKRIGEYERILSSIYMNSDHPMIKYYIEDLADKYGGDLLHSINMHKND